jgi:hypothetical protein
MKQLRCPMWTNARRGSQHCSQMLDGGGLREAESALDKKGSIMGRCKGLAGSHHYIPIRRKQLHMYQP